MPDSGNCCAQRYYFLYEINWDEFFFLNHIYDHQRGDLGPVFQTIHVHAFKWLPVVSENEAQQIVAARIVMGALHLLTTIMIFRISRLFCSLNASLFAALAYTSFSYVVWQGTSFRADPVAATLLMGAIYLLLRPRPSPWALPAAGMLTAIAAMVTIKSVFFVPTLALILLTGRRDDHATFPLRARRTLCFGVVSAVCLAILYTAHAASFPAGAPGTSQQVLLQGSILKSFNLSPLYPGFFVFSVLTNPFFWAFALTGLARALIGSSRKALALAFALPLLSLLFYRHSFPYFYVFLLPPVAVLCAFSWDLLATSRLQTRGALLAGASFVFAANLIAHGFMRTYQKPLTANALWLPRSTRPFPSLSPILTAAV